LLLADDNELTEMAQLEPCDHTQRLCSGKKDGISRAWQSALMFSNQPSISMKKTTITKVRARTRDAVQRHDDLRAALREHDFGKQIEPRIVRIL